MSSEKRRGEQRTERTSAGVDRKALLARIRQEVGACEDRNEALRRTVRLLSEGVPYYTWTGIYLIEKETLVLHNQIGDPTPHEHIPIGEGICGLAARERRTVNVPDVGRDPRYLACSLSTRSEMVVPIFKGSRVVGEIDIDSDRTGAFGPEDQLLLEETAQLLGSRF